MTTATIAKPAGKAKPTAEAKPTKPKGKAQHPSVDSKDPSVYPFATTPTDYDPSKHAPLKKRDFIEDWQFLQYRLELARRNVADLEKKVEEAKTMGSTKDKAGAKRLVKLTQRLADLKQKLQASNMDVGQVLRSSGVDLDTLKSLIDAAEKNAG